MESGSSPSGNHTSAPNMHNKPRLQTCMGKGVHISGLQVGARRQRHADRSSCQRAMSTGAGKKKRMHCGHSHRKVRLRVAVAHADPRIHVATAAGVSARLCTCHGAHGPAPCCSVPPGQQGAGSPRQERLALPDARAEGHVLRSGQRFGAALPLDEGRARAAAVQHCDARADSAGLATGWAEPCRC